MRVLNGGDERTSQINIAVRNSTSKYLYYTGADFRVEPTLLEDAVAAAERESADAVWINCISEDNGFWGRVRHFERETYIGSVDFESARFFTREMYERVGGYDDSVPVFEEYDLQDRMMAAGARFTRIATAAEHHLDEPKRLSQIWWRSYYIGSLYRNLVSKQGASALRHLNPVRRTFFKDPKRYLQHPVLTVGFIMLLLAKYGGGAAGILVSFLPRWLRPKR
jgi:GT2 family glycosyltransferase